MAFSEANWHRFDYFAIVANNGFAVLEPERRPACREWLRAQGYRIDTVDFSDGRTAAVQQFAEVLEWENLFGYPLTGESPNLDALNDGIGHLTAEQPRVLELVRADIAWEEDPEWVQGLLSILRTHSLTELSVGRRFLTLLVIPETSTLIGSVFEEVRVPYPYRPPGRNSTPFG